jgi:RHS repeat-associated protein
MMKTKTRFATRLVMVTCALVAAQSALAFYNPSTGRWLSRDPIEEAGSIVATKPELSEKDAGPNHYAFIANSPVNEVDYAGLYRFLGRHSIEVSPCEIVFVYGHGIQKP